MTQTSPTTQAPTSILLDAILHAYAAGDAPLGEYLFLKALDEGLPWDQACSTVASGIAQRNSESSGG